MSTENPRTAPTQEDWDKLFTLALKYKEGKKMFSSLSTEGLANDVNLDVEALISDGDSLLESLALDLKAVREQFGEVEKKRKDIYQKSNWIDIYIKPIAAALSRWFGGDYKLYTTGEEPGRSSVTIFFKDGYQIQLEGEPVEYGAMNIEYLTGKMFYVNGEFRREKRTLPENLLSIKELVTPATLLNLRQTVEGVRPNKTYSYKLCSEDEACLYGILPVGFTLYDEKGGEPPLILDNKGRAYIFKKRYGINLPQLCTTQEGDTHPITITTFAKREDE